LVRVFISHTADDSEAARQLREELVKRSIDVWDPVVELSPGSNWLLETGKALERADSIVFLFSASTADSSSMRREVEFALTNEKFEKRVIPVLLSKNVERFPWILTKFQVIDASSGDMKRVASNIASILHVKPAQHASSERASVKRRGS